MVSGNGGASDGQLASIASSVAATWAGRMLCPISPNKSATATLLRWFGHSATRLPKDSPLAAGQAPKAAPRDLL
jgi:hypothetical protein